MLEDFGAKLAGAAQREKTLIELVQAAERSLESAQQIFRDLSGALVGMNRPIRGEANLVGEVADTSIRGRALMLERQLAGFVREIEDVKRSVYVDN